MRKPTNAILFTAILIAGLLTHGSNVRAEGWNLSAVAGLTASGFGGLTCEANSRIGCVDPAGLGIVAGLGPRYKVSWFQTGLRLEVTTIADPDAFGLFIRPQLFAGVDVAWFALEAGFAPSFVHHGPEGRNDVLFGPYLQIGINVSRKVTVAARGEMSLGFGEVTVGGNLGAVILWTI